MLLFSLFKVKYITRQYPVNLLNYLKLRLATSRLHEFLKERSEFFMPRRGQANDEVPRHRTKDFFENLFQTLLNEF